MRLLLIQAVSTVDGGEMVYPLGLARLAALLKGEHTVKGVDLNLHLFPWPILSQTLQEFKPEVVGISFRNLDPLAGAHSSFARQLKALSALIKSQAPQAVQIIGGSGFSLFSRRILAEVPALDLGLVGEGEVAFPQLLSNLEDPLKVEGVVSRRQTEPEVSYCHLESMDQLPLPEWDLFPPSEYQKKNRYVSFMGVETKRGCPFSCQYCLYPVLQGRRVRLRLVSDVVDEIELLRYKYGAETIHFTDAVVNNPPGHLKAVCLETIRRRLYVKWTGFFREDTLSSEDMELYKEAGLAAVYFSGDGTSDKMLELLKKGFNRQVILRAADIAAKSALPAVYHFLVNLPGENNQTVRQTKSLLDEILALHAGHKNPAAFVFNNLRLYPGAPLTEEILAGNLIDARTDLLYPAYYNPPPFDGLRYDLTARSLRPEDFAL